MPKMTWHTVNKRLLWQHLIRMVIDKICKMTVKGVKSRSESSFSISYGVLELLRKTLGKGGFRLLPPPAWIGLRFENCQFFSPFNLYKVLDRHLECLQCSTEKFISERVVERRNAPALSWLLATPMWWGESQIGEIRTVAFMYTLLQNKRERWFRAPSPHPSFENWWRKEDIIIILKGIHLLQNKRERWFRAPFPFPPPPSLPTIHWRTDDLRKTNYNHFKGNPLEIPI